MRDPLHPLEQVELDINVTFRGELARRVCEHSERLGIEPVQLLADIVELVFMIDKVDLVLGIGEEHG